MDYAEFEQLVLRVLFETDVPVTSARMAHLGHLPVRTTERFLARMVEDGTLIAQTSASGLIEYRYPGRRPRTRTADADGPHAPGDPAGPPGISIGSLVPVGGPALPARTPQSPVTAVLLSMILPGAGHIYAGRPAAGAAWMAATLMGYACFFLPGLFLHGLCLVSAAQPHTR